MKAWAGNMDRAEGSGFADPATALAHVGLGSNLAPDLYIVRAVMEIRARMTVPATSRFYRTQPHPPSRSRGQPAFVNGVLFVRVRSGRDELRYGTLREIESRLGRIRTSDPFAARVIDLDLLTYRRDAEDCGTDVWVDPEIVRRPYWAVPLAELAPGLRVPGSRCALGDLAAAMKDSRIVYLESLTAEIRGLLDLDRDG